MQTQPLWRIAAVSLFFTAAGGRQPVINPHATTRAPSAEAGEQKQ